VRTALGVYHELSLRLANARSESLKDFDCDSAVSVLFLSELLQLDDFFVYVKLRHDSSINILLRLGRGVPCTTHMHNSTTARDTGVATSELLGPILCAGHGLAR